MFPVCSGQYLSKGSEEGTAVNQRQKLTDAQGERRLARDARSNVNAGSERKVSDGPDVCEAAQTQSSHGAHAHLCLLPENQR